MRGFSKWLVGRLGGLIVPVARHVVPPILVAILAALADVGLLDGEMYRALAGLLN